MTDIDTSKTASKIIDGRAVASKVEAEAAAAILKLKEKGISPKLVTVLVGADPASQMYVRMKHKACERVGILAENCLRPADITEEELFAVIDDLNKDKTVSSILVQLPLPRHINEKAIMNAISPNKDPDGFHPVHMGNLMVNEEGLVPCTPKGIIRLMDEYNVDIKGKNAVVIGRSNIVGKPMAILLLNEHCTVTLCHSRTADLAGEVKQADIVIAAVGKAGIITGDMIKPGSVVIDVGTNRIDGKLTGDVDFDSAVKTAGYITPVPGGVGPMTIAMLMRNTMNTYFKNN